MQRHMSAVEAVVVEEDMLYKGEKYTVKDP
jgi:hypothetical protein